FGPDPEDVKAITGWLSSKGFQVEEVAKGQTWINFSGGVSHVEQAFKTRMHDYQVDGKIYHANAVDPEIPRALGEVVSGVVSLHSFPRKAMNNGLKPLAPAAQSAPDYSAGGSTHYLSPADFATIY